MRIFLHEHVVTLSRNAEIEIISRGDSSLGFADPDEGYLVRAFVHGIPEGREIDDSTARQWLNAKKGFHSIPEDERHDSAFDPGPYITEVNHRCAYMGDTGDPATQCRRLATKWEQIGMTRQNFCDEHGIEVARGRL